MIININTDVNIISLSPQLYLVSNFGSTEIAGLDNGGSDIDGLIWAIDCN